MLAPELPKCLHENHVSPQKYPVTPSLDQNEKAYSIFKSQNCWDKPGTKAGHLCFLHETSIPMTHLQTGHPAPEFEGLDQNGNTVRLSDFKGKKVVLYFYPKDDTPGCTAEACDFRDNYNQLTEKGIQVIGVSADSQKSHLKFADKYRLNFPLLADENRQIIEAYGVWGIKKFMGREYDGIHRETFVIDETGKIEAVLTKVETKASTAQVLSALGS